MSAISSFFLLCTAVCSFAVFRSESCFNHFSPCRPFISISIFILKAHSLNQQSCLHPALGPLPPSLPSRPPCLRLQTPAFVIFPFFLSTCAQVLPARTRAAPHRWICILYLLGLCACSLIPQRVAAEIYVCAQPTGVFKATLQEPAGCFTLCK